MFTHLCDPDASRWIAHPAGVMIRAIRVRLLSEAQADVMLAVLRFHGRATRPRTAREGSAGALVRQR